MSDIRSTGKPGELSIGSWACALCGAVPKTLLDDVVSRMPPARRRRGRAISKKTQFNMTHRFKCRTCGRRAAKPGTGPRFLVQQVEIREEGIYTVST